MTSLYDNTTLAELKEQLPQYLESICGITDLRHPFCCLNPAHEDRHPSMHFNNAANRVHCFSCGADGDLFDVIGWVEGAVNFPAKVEAAARAIGYPPLPAISTSINKRSSRIVSSQKPMLYMPKPISNNDFFETMQRAMWVLLEEPQGKVALDYLHRRGFTDEEIADAYIGWVQHPSEVFPSMGEVPGCNDGFLILGFPELTESISSDAGIPILPYHVAVPYAVFRRADGIGPKELKPKGLTAPVWREHLLNGGFRTGDEIYVVEGIFDAMSLTALLDVQACAICGSSGITRLLQIMAHTPETERPKLKLAFDQDATGAKYTEAAKKSLQELGIPYSVAKPYPSGFKDANEWLMRKRGCHE